MRKANTAFQDEANNGASLRDKYLYILKSKGISYSRK